MRDNRLKEFVKVQGVFRRDQDRLAKAQGIKIRRQFRPVRIDLVDNQNYGFGRPAENLCDLPVQRLQAGRPVHDKRMRSASSTAKTAWS